MKANGTLGKQSNTKAEQQVYQELLKSYSPDDIIQQYFGGERYPYICDFYIISEDLFIEVNANWTHGPKQFDPNDDDWQDLLSLWTLKAETSNYYKNAIYTWTVLDVNKAECAKRNHLNFKAIY